MMILLSLFHTYIYNATIFINYTSIRKVKKENTHRINLEQQKGLAKNGSPFLMCHYSIILIEV